MRDRSLPLNDRLVFESDCLRIVGAQVRPKTEAQESTNMLILPICMCILEMRAFSSSAAEIRDFSLMETGHNPA